MQFVIGLLIVIIGIMAVYIWKYQRQVHDICRQLSFLQETDSNMLITEELHVRSIANLTKILNEFLHIIKRERREYLEKEKNISDIYTNISHDIRTPLTSLDGYFQLLENAENAGEQARYIGIIQERISSLKDMLEELFEYTKLENASYQLEMTNCCINRILKDTVFSYYEEWEKQGIQAEFSITEELLYMNGNEQALRRIIQNIIKNALVHGENKMSFVLEKCEEEIVLRVGNQVRNPSKIDVTQVFERFYKAEKSRSKNSTGLGLSIARELVLHMDGRITAEAVGDEFGIIMHFPCLKVE